MSDPGEGSRGKTTQSKATSSKNRSHAEESDIHALMGQRIVREKTMIQQKSDQPQYKV